MVRNLFSVCSELLYNGDVTFLFLNDVLNCVEDDGVEVEHKETCGYIMEVVLVAVAVLS